MSLHFMGQDFATVADLRKVYPVYATRGPLADIRAGCTTIDQVEERRAARLADAHRKNVAQAKAASLRGGLASARSGKA